jgi:TonB-dependent receptor
LISLSNLYGRTDREEVRRRRRYRWSEQRQEFDVRDRDGATDVISSALSGEHLFFKKLQFTWQGSFSQSTQKSPDVIEMRFRELSAFDSQGKNLTNQNTDTLVSLAYNHLNETWLNLASIDSDEIKEQAITLQGDFKVKYQLNVKTPGYIKFGVKYRDNQRERMRDRLVGNYFSATSGEISEFVQVFPNLYPRVVSNGGIAMSSFLNGPSATNFLNGKYFMGPGSGETNGPGLGNVATSNLVTNMRSLNFLSKDFLADIDDNNTTEKVVGLYAMTEVEFSQKFLLLTGLRFERTITTYRGNYMTTGVDYDDGGAFASVVKDSVGQRNYNEFLPMAHLRYRAKPWLDIRAAVTRTLSRPDFGNLIPFRRINDNEQTIQQANPQLLQIQAWNYDLSFSAYNKNGLITLGGFYKQLANVDYTRTFTRLLPENDPYVGYTISSPENSTGTTTIFGAEFDLQANFRFLPKPFNGFIFSGNLTLLNSETFYPYIPDPLRSPEPPFTAFPVLDGFRAGRAPRQAGIITNVSLGYETGGFSGRVSLVYQGDTFTALGTRNSLDSFQQGNTRIDVAVKQKINNYLKVYLNCNNLTNAAEISFLGNSNRRTAEDYYGFTIDLGIQFQMQ